MKCSLSTQAYKWRSGDGWNVGRLVEQHNEQGWWWFAFEAGAISPTNMLSRDFVLVAHSHTSELEFVRWGDLSAYGPPGEPAMPQPESKETVK